MGGGVGDDVVVVAGVGADVVGTVVVVAQDSGVTPQHVPRQYWLTSCSWIGLVVQHMSEWQKAVASAAHGSVGDPVGSGVGETVGAADGADEAGSPSQ